MSAQYADHFQTVALLEGKQHPTNDLSGQFVCCPRGEEERGGKGGGPEEVVKAKGWSGKHGQERYTKEQDRAWTEAAVELGQNCNRQLTKNGLQWLGRSSTQALTHTARPGVMIGIAASGVTQQCRQEDFIPRWAGLSMQLTFLVHVYSAIDSF